MVCGIIVLGSDYDEGRRGGLDGDCSDAFLLTAIESCAMLNVVNAFLISRPNWNVNYDIIDNLQVDQIGKHAFSVRCLITTK